MSDNKEILVLCEFETKYKVKSEQLYDFKKIMENLNPKKFLYVESDDVYYVTGEKFIRHRLSPYNTNDRRQELTMKEKLSETNNIQRTEINLRVDHNTEFVVEAFCNMLGYQKNFRITKYCHIYFFEKATMSFYSVKDGENMQHFLEIEVKEDMEFTEEEGWEIIKRWEEHLKPLGISSKNRIRKSLFEMYKR